MGVLTQEALNDAQESIKKLYPCTQKIDSIDRSLLQRTVTTLLIHAQINPSAALVDLIINTSIEIANVDRSKVDFNEVIYGLKENLSIRLQRENEMNATSHTQEQMADIFKIYVCLITSIMDILQPLHS